MAYPVDSAKHGVDQPYDALTTTRSLSLTTANATITLVSGVYDLFHTASGAVAVRMGAVATAVPPSTGAAEVTGFLIPAGAVASIAIDAADAAAGILHACTLASTGTMYLVRKVLA